MDVPPEIGFDRQFGTLINGVHTEFVFHRFAGQWLLLVTQLGKIGVIYDVSFDVKLDARKLPVNLKEYHTPVVLSTKCCLGNDTSETVSAIQFLANNTMLNRCPKNLIIGLGLKNIETKVLHEIAEVLEQMVFK
ncbi:uncharacterized protein LOC115631122 [Scaptodrosophila lebanonensis]|uniref:Uncharacterized protein LOC115631122 n=1 Tax=Drosophila lebanonensis TaxID=7225 RepID=A0A6J2U7X1_DROLE|nr:uncharacterized protein LOC115631122 [Scaptodrosophila lebanonensis]